MERHLGYSIIVFLAMIECVAHEHHVHVLCNVFLKHDAVHAWCTPFLASFPGHMLHAEKWEGLGDRIT